ncbi:MAG: DNA-3-methyladenine glycosylase I [Anaerolineae bacterium]
MPPPRPADDAGYLEAAARIIFMGGLNRRVVDNKWPGFRLAFSGFDPDTVAAMGPDDVARLSQDDRVIKYAAKLAAVVQNAQAIRRLSPRQGGFGAYVDGLLAEKGLEGACKQLAADFSYISLEGARHWLYSTGRDIGEVTAKIQAKYAPFDN